ncbi:hypothetical protein [Fontivita pretiosa]|uniref:hypothetical protein n=1 Tax=Fontivita pretiosa TaxID=2989684 RepID=UPI003D17DCDA
MDLRRPDGNSHAAAAPGGATAASSSRQVIRARRVDRVLLAAGALLLAATIARLIWALPRYEGIIHVSGVWTTLAIDLTNGLFYRPLVSESGYGGTRYMPLHFTLHAGLIKLGLDPIRAGNLLAVCSGAVLLLGTFQLLRRLGIGPSLAAGATMLLLGCTSVQMGLSDIRPDLLAAGLNIWGLVVCLPRPGGGTCVRWPGLMLAAMLFVLAFGAKLTSLFGLAAAVLWLALAGRRRDAAGLLLLTLCGIVVMVAGIYWTSEGRAWESMRACATAGASLGRLLESPHLLFNTSRSFDLPGFVLILLAMAALLPAGPGAWLSLPAVLLILTGGATLLIFASPGTEANHLVDLDVAATVALAWQVARFPHRLAFAKAAMAVLALASAAVLYEEIRDDRASTSHRQQILHVLDNVGDRRDGPILSEDPLVPIFAGEAVYMLDPFLFRVIALEDASFAQRLWSKLEARQFRAVVLLTDPSREGGRAWYHGSHFGPGFVERVLSNYRLVAWNDRYLVYRPLRVIDGR